MPSPVLTRPQLEAAFARVLLGEKITSVAEDFGVHSSALTNRLRRNFPREYAEAAACGVISRRSSADTLRKRAEQGIDSQAVKSYLAGEGSYKKLSVIYGVGVTTLQKRVERALRAQEQKTIEMQAGRARRDNKEGM